MLRRGSFWINSNGTIIKEGNVFITYEGKGVLVGTILVGVRFYWGCSGVYEGYVLIECADISELVMVRKRKDI